MNTTGLQFEPADPRQYPFYPSYIPCPYIIFIGHTYSLQPTRLLHEWRLPISTLLVAALSAINSFTVDLVRTNVQNGNRSLDRPPYTMPQALGLVFYWHRACARHVSKVGEIGRNGRICAGTSVHGIESSEFSYVWTQCLGIGSREADDNIRRHRASR